jgi:recombination protein RecR
MAKYPAALLALMTYLRRLPGVGNKTAERFAFDLFNWNEEDLAKLAHTFKTLKETVLHCTECNCLIDQNHCFFCNDPLRNRELLCVTASVKDVFIIEETNAFRGLYHVINGMLSPLKGKSPENLQLDRLKNRLDALKVKEVIIALDSTLEGDTTSLFLKQQLEKWNLPSSRLAFGLPMGSSLDFVDRGTLAHAINRRLAF